MLTNSKLLIVTFSLNLKKKSNNKNNNNNIIPTYDNNIGAIIV